MNRHGPCLKILSQVHCLILGLIVLFYPLLLMKLTRVDKTALQCSNKESFNLSHPLSPIETLQIYSHVLNSK